MIMIQVKFLGVSFAATHLPNWQQWQYKKVFNGVSQFYGGYESNGVSRIEKQETMNMNEVTEVLSIYYIRVIRWVLSRVKFRFCIYINFFMRDSDICFNSNKI